ncbi:PREDICTED: tetraspanin-7-like [Amphimedon queenslandica]|uniref:Tetraspanin n=1 Tax=Amphimedon queenslandica TaxID=400682 RepID=A0A1X7VWA1_AMPQE|nr:PREDICTED: tetraspanin-7-like [Amphimedon queenslandica]|eukprot:XP_003382522.1 PREDICTED: tetraspanin-7-like [Amphimedon queenslandica]
MGVKECPNCCRNFIRFILAAVNIGVCILGLSVLIVGAWGAGTNHDYLKVTEDTKSYTQVPTLLIIIGLFVFIFGIVGVVGAIFAHTLGGRIILGLYGFVLALFVIIEFAGGIAAGVESGQVGNAFSKAFNDSFSKYTDNSTDNKQAWDSLQESLKCCGIDGPSSYREKLNMEPPTSCCDKKIDSNCDTTIDANLYNTGCADQIKSDIKYILGVVAGIGITFALLQLVGVVFSLYVAIVAHKKDNYEVV